MADKETPFFDRDHAASYDARNAPWAPVRAALLLLMCRVLSDLPTDAHVLCVGAGTGSELLDLARIFPGWRFTALDPSGPMLEVCRRRAGDAGVTARCTFHHGYLDSLPASEPFDAATSLLVSQFILQPEERRRFFSQIASRLCPGGYLVSADLAYSRSPATYGDLRDVWLRMHAFAGASPEQLETLVAAMGRNVAVSATQEIEALIASSGFSTPVLFFQAFLIHAWFAQRTSDPVSLSCL